MATADGAPGSDRRIVAGGLQPVQVSGRRERRSVRPNVGKRTVTVRACAPSAGRITVTLTRRGVRVARRTVTTRRGRLVTVRFDRPRGRGPLHATVRFPSRAL